MKHRYFWLIALMFTLFSSQAQTNSKDADSIAQLIKESSRQDSNYVKLLLEYYKFSAVQYPDSAMNICQQALEISKNTGFNSGEIKALNALGVCFWYQNIPDQTISYFHQALSQSEKYQNRDLRALVCNNLGLYYVVIGVTDSAVKFHQMSVDAASINKDNSRYIKSISDLGMAYFYQGNYMEAIQRLMEAKIYYEQKNMSAEQALTCTRIGMIYTDLSIYEKSMYFYREALRINNIKNDITIKVSTLLNMGKLLYEFKQNNDSARIYLKECMQLANKNGIEDFQIAALINLGNIELEENNFSQALIFYQEAMQIPVFQIRNRHRAALFVNMGIACFELHDLKNAEKYTIDGLKIAREQKFLSIEKNAWNKLGDIQAKKGQYKEAFESYVKYASLLDSLSNENLKHKLAETVFEISLEQKEKENLLLQKENEIKQHIIAKQWYFIIATALIIILGLIIIMIIIRNTRNQKALNLILATKNKELKELNQTKDKFFSVISHDLRMPFNGFLGLTKLLVEEMPLLTRDDIKKIANSMLISATNIYQLLEELLEWARLQNGKIEIHRNEISVLDLVQESIRSISDLAAKKEIELSFNIPEGLNVFGDASMLKSVIRNIVSNAIKFTPSGGKICLGAKAKDEHYILFSISDSGIGMSHEIIENLFRLDIKSSRKGTEEESGTGLGLIICKEIILKHAGEIWVESKEGTGSTFHFTLPHKFENM
ncbi:MAG: tetratricopeptide repeat-containing sensor histidine kinase [Bacteroidales bacterium]